MESLLDDAGSDTIDLTTLNPADKPELRPSEGNLPKLARDLDSGLDPEPDAAIKPPDAAPSADPLDRPKPPPAPKAGDAKPSDPNSTQPQQAEEPLPPLNAAIKAALERRDAVDVKGPNAAERRKEREVVGLYYAAQGFAPAWSEKGELIAAVEPVLGRLARAGEDALSLPSPPKDLTLDGKDEYIAASDIALTDAVVSYARQASGSRIDPHAISPLIGVKPELVDPTEVLDSVIAAGAEGGDKLQALNPIDSRYVALRKKLAELRVGSIAAASTPIPAGPTLRVGMRDPRVPLIRSRFGLESGGDADEEISKYDTAIAGAVANFQRANGLPPSGMLTQRTQAALSGGRRPSRLDETIIANMEMWRWMPRDLGADRIEVNVPAYTVTVFRDDQPVTSHRVVVGKTDTPTPIFSNKMKFLIVNPVWNVPQSIIEKEFGGGERRGFKARYVHGKLYLQQASGPGNALGRIKFMFPNDFSVYLHDTPAKGLFSASRRAFSHGCVRVDKPFDFAASVLNDGVSQGGKILWSKKRLEKMLGDKERYVNLPEPLPIHIVYFTATIAPESGKLQLRDDIYGYVRRVSAALGRDS